MSDWGGLEWPRAGECADVRLAQNSTTNLSNLVLPHPLPPLPSHELLRKQDGKAKMKRTSRCVEFFQHESVIRPFVQASCFLLT